MSSFHNSGASSPRIVCVLSISVLSLVVALHSASANRARLKPATKSLGGQSQDEADKKTSGCISCHTATDEPTMHPTRTVHLGCTDCHGGNSSVGVAPGMAPGSPEYNSIKEKAHVQPRNVAFKKRANLPERAYTLWLKESAEYIKFVNPGDLRVATEACGAIGCRSE